MSKKQIPAAAFRFNAGEVALEVDGDPLSTRVSLLARSTQPIEHWYWGRVVHDLAGVQVAKEKLPIDYAHKADEVIGFLDSFNVDEGGLRTEGQLVVFNDDDRAAEVAYKSAQGVPYEASINFGGDGIKLEQVDEGASVEVNGYQFEGPGVVVRSWPLRGVAVCPYGADPATESTIFDTSGGEIVVEFLSGKVNKMATRKSKKSAAAEKLDAVVVDEPLADEATDQVDADQVAADEAAVAEIADETAPEADDQADDQAAEKPEADVKLEPKFSQDEGRRFVAEFGEIGAVWFVEGLTFEQAQDRHLSQLKGRLDELLAENEKLKGRVDAAEFGENEPVEFSAAAVGDDLERSAIRSDYEKKLPRAAAAFATRFDVSRNGNGQR